MIIIAKTATIIMAYRNTVKHTFQIVEKGALRSYLLQLYRINSNLKLESAVHEGWVNVLRAVNQSNNDRSETSKKHLTSYCLLKYDGRKLISVSDPLEKDLLRLFMRVQLQLMLRKH